MQEVSFMCYTNIRDTIKWWYLHTKKLKYCSSAKFDEHNNKICKVWSPGSKIMTVTNFSILPTLKLISQIIPSSKTIYDRFIRNAPWIYIFSKNLLHIWIALEVYFLMIQGRFDIS